VAAEIDGKISDRRLKRLVNEVLRERITDADIQSVSIVRDVDDDGEAILRLKIVFDGAKNSLDSNQTSSVARYVVSRLANEGEHAFPVISYVAESELRKSKTAAGA